MKYKKIPTVVHVFKWDGDPSLIDEIEEVLKTINESEEGRTFKVFPPDEDNVMGVSERDDYGSSLNSAVYPGQYIILDTSKDIMAFSSCDESYLISEYEPF